MKRTSACAFVLILFVLLHIGCASPYYGHYYGYSQQKWEQLSAEEKQSAQAEYQDIIDYKHRRQHEDQFDARKQQIIHHGAGF
jgi:hypothetical protein